MNSGIKRLLSMLVALMMVFSMITPVSASAAGNTKHNKTVEIEVAESTKLKVPGVHARITWGSSDEGIAKVSEKGTVTGVAPGTATITATYKTHFGFWGRNKTTTFTVVVTEPEAQSVTVEEGKTLQLKVNAKHSKVSWNSSDTTVVTVTKNGQIKGIAPGTAMVTAKISGSHGFFGKKTETVYFEVTVTEAPEEETPEQPEALTVKEGETLQLTVDAKGGKVTWKSSNRKVATVNRSGLVTGVKAGNVTITASVARHGKAKPRVVAFDVTVLPPINYYTVTFNSNGGSEVAEQTIEEGMTATQPEDPTLEGYTFKGWYTDEALSQAYDFAVAVTADVTLYAKWEENEPARPTIPENPSAADEYFFNNSEVIAVINVEESTDIMTESEAKALLNERGFVDFPVVYQYDMAGEYIAEHEASESSAQKYPMYHTYYLSKNRDLWTVYVVNGDVVAFPASINLDSGRSVEVLVTEANTLTSYDDETNKFYITIPYSSMAVIKTVDNINSDTLDGLTIEELGNL